MGAAVIPGACSKNSAIQESTLHKANSTLHKGEQSTAVYKWSTLQFIVHLT